jgi:hypothetical protein
MSSSKAARVGEEYVTTIILLPMRSLPWLFADYDQDMEVSICRVLSPFFFLPRHIRSRPSSPSLLDLCLIVCVDQRGRIDKVNAELVTLTYGTIVAQLCKDFEGDYVQVNKQLDTMGYNIGLRLIEDYLAKSNTMRRCANFRETADMIAKVCLYPTGRGCLPSY